MTHSSTEQAARRRLSWGLIGMFAILVALLVGFGVLAFDVWRHISLPWDTSILRAIHQYATPGRDTVMIMITRVGLWGVVAADIVVLLILALLRRWRDALFFALAVGGAGLLNMTIKAVFQRVRPALWVSPAPEQTYSFPSGHAMGSMALVAALGVLAWPTRWRWPAVILGAIFTLAVGLSRMYLGVHYPSDVLAAWAASLVWVLGVSMVVWRRAAKPSAAASQQVPELEANPHDAAAP